ncbi:MAG: ABC transporter substrate-binding protein [Actinomycetota bacterium]
MKHQDPSRRRAIPVLLALALLGAACGSDDTSDSSATADVADAGDVATETTTGGDPASGADDDSSGSEATSSATADDATADESSASGTAGTEETDGAAGTEAADDEAAGATKIVQTSFGEVEVPVDPERIVALDAVAAMNLISVGVEPTTVFDINGAEAVRNVLTDRGIELRSDLGDGFSELNYEAVAAERPDLIMIVAVDGFESLTDPLREIAPTIVVPFFGTWEEMMTDTGAIFDRQDEAAAVIEGLEQRFAEVSDVVAGDPFSLSILASGLGFLLALSPDASISLTADAVGISRPAAQTGDIPPFMGQPAFSVSEELLIDHDADVVALLAGQFYDDAAVRAIPTFDNLSAAQEGNVVTVDGDLWFTGHPFAVFWQLADLEAIATGDAEAGVGSAADSLERWAQYVELGAA